MTDDIKASPTAQVRALYEQAEADAAQTMEDLVAKRSFGKLMAMAAENVAAVARISTDSADLALRNLRLAGRADITRLARQLHRTEDKLERVLQEVEQLRDELAAARNEAAARHDALQAARQDELAATHRDGAAGNQLGAGAS
ncbi:MAG: hypothetical protein ACLP0J_11680 [Solirubrobacteraceae bacterium]